MGVLQNSGYLDFTSWGTTTATTVPQAYGFDLANIEPYLGTEPIYNVALILPRANDPTALLQSDWATRQSTLARMEADGTLWTTYGADQATYDTAVAALAAMGISVLGDADATDGHVSSAASRTIWVDLTPAQFSQLFGTPLLVNNEAGNFKVFYEGDLTLPADIPATGLYIEGAYGTAVSAQSTASVTLEPGPQSPGNASTAPIELPPQDIAALYHLPLTGSSSVTGTLALVEPMIGTALPADSTTTFNQALADYLAAIGVTGAPQTYTVANGGQEFIPELGGERSLDVGVVAAVNPNSTIGFYAGSGLLGGSTFSAYQGAIWDLARNPSVLSSSFGDVAVPTPDSPFFAAFQELYVDAALRGLSIYIAAGDGGSGGEVASGLPNFQAASSSPYVTLVGGTSMSLVPAAEADATLAALLAAVEAKDLGTLRMLVEGGLAMAPTALNAYNSLVETVWNQYNLRSEGLLPGYLENAAGAGAVDTRLEIPSYQAQFGLTPTNPMGGTGRGLPDVSANSGGNLTYWVPNADLTAEQGVGGTSASTPLWAALALQVNTIFEAQLLPKLGMSTDLLYIAAAIAPGAFNDVVLGNNISTYVAGGTVVTQASPTSPAITITPTGIGYEAGEGYDLTTGLGTPNGTLLARALATIGQTQMHPHVAAVLEGTGDGIHYVSGASQSLIVQSSLAQATTFGLTVDGHASTFAGAMGDAYAWNAAFAQKSLQAGFSPELVTLFDRQAQGTITQMDVAAGAHLSVDIGGASAAGYQVDLTSDFGFGSFAGAGGAVEVARAVAVASTAGGLDDQTALVRLRQNGMFDLEVQFYKVDDLNGTIAGLAPGAAGYAAAAQGRAYLTSDGDTWVKGAGYGAYGSDALFGVDAGDLIAMRLFNGKETFWAFSAANETVGGQSVAHLMGYGLNTWGWEDTYGGGDHDYNDLVVQLDFSSAYTANTLANANEWLA